MSRVLACRVEDLTDGQGKLVVAFGRKVAVFSFEGRYYAMDDACPHRGGALSDGDLDDGQVFCPLHAWAFDLETGQMRGNPSCRVPVYTVTEDDGALYLARAEPSPPV